MKLAGLAAGGVLLVLAPVAMAAVMPVTSAHLTVFEYPVRIRPIDAAVDVKPESLEVSGTGVPVTAFIELPDGRPVGSVNVASVRLCAGTSPCTAGVPAGGKPKVGDADADGVPDLKVTFDRRAVLRLFDRSAAGIVTVAVSGLAASDAFVGTDTVRLVP